MGRKWAIFLLLCVVLFGCCSSASAKPPAKIVSGVVSNVVSALFKWLWSLKSTPKTVVSSRSLMKFEGGYDVETVFDGSKLGIEPHSLEISPTGELLVLDSENSNIYKISTPLSRYSRPKLVAGSPEGYYGHVDGKPREARMNHPKGLTMDDRGNIYVADTMNMAIRKISDAGVVTIAGGGKWSHGGGHVDGPSEDAKFSNDFDVVYIGSSCSLLVVDRGNQAIREIHLQDDDCSYESDGNLYLGIAVLAAAGFFGYMLALLQRRVAAMFSSHNDPRASMKGIPPTTYQRPLKSVHPPLIPPDESKKSEEGLVGSLGRLTGSIFGGLFSGSAKKPRHHTNQHYHQQPANYSNPWPVQESFVIPDGDEPPSLDTRDPTPRKTYPFMTKDVEPTRNFKKSRSFYSGRNDNFHQQPQQQVQLQQQQIQQQQHHQRNFSSGPQTHYEPNCETKTNEIVFGAVQEQDGRREAVVIKAVDYGDRIYNNHEIRSRYNYTGYSYGY